MTRPGQGFHLKIEKSAPPQWERLLQNDPCADYFHTSHWVESAARTHPGAESRWICLFQNDQLLAGLAALRTTGTVTRWQSGLEGSSGGPLLDSSLSEDQKREAFNQLIDCYEGMQGSALASLCLSLNEGHEQRAELWWSEARNSWQRQDIMAAAIPLEGGLEFVEMNLMKKNKRNERNRGERRNARVLISQDPGDLAAYYPLYEQACRTWEKTPAPLIFLQALLADPARQTDGSTRAFFTCVQLEDQVIGGHLNLHYGDRVIAWNGVTDPEYSRTHFPATLAVWGDLQEACRRGARWLDLGASGGVVSLEGFKKHFGARTEMRAHYVCESQGVKLLRGGKTFLKNLRSGSSGSGARRWHDTPGDNDTTIDNVPPTGQDPSADQDPGP